MTFGVTAISFVAWISLGFGRVRCGEDKELIQSSVGNIDLSINFDKKLTKFYKKKSG